MSVGAATALQNGKPYLQSPVDDIESFFWVLLYAIIQNSSASYKRDWELRSAYDTEGRAVALRIFNIAFYTPEDYCQLTCTLSASKLLDKYDTANKTLRNHWHADHTLVEAVEPPDVAGTGWLKCYITLFI